MPKKSKKGRAAVSSNKVVEPTTISACVDNTLKIEEEDTNNNNNNNIDINEENQQMPDKPGMVIATAEQSVANATATATTPHDEINEEFDFNDGLLSELSDKESLLEEHTGGEQVLPEDQPPNGLGPGKCIDDNGDCEMEPAAAAANKATADNAGECDKTTTTTTATSTMETPTTQQALINDNNDNKLNRPSNLLLGGGHESTMSDATNLHSTSSPPPEGEDSYCPITPRRIMDVEDTDSEGEPRQQPAKSQSKSNIKSAANNNNTAGDVDNADGDDDDYDDAEDYNPDDELLVQFLGEANRIAEARLAARRQARAEAREIRMRELERQQREQENNADRAYADSMHSSSSLDPLVQSRLLRGTGAVTSSPSAMLSIPRGNSLMSSRRSSEDSLEEEGRSLRDIRHELKDVEERFRKAMIANAQLDNERASQTYQIQLLKDKLEEMEESYAQLQREFKEKSRDYNALKRNLDKLTEELKLVQGQLNERDSLIGEQGLVIVAVENEDGTDAKRALVSVENAQLLGSVQGSLDVRLKKFSEEKKVLSMEVQNLQQQLEQYKQQGGGGGKLGRGNSMNGPSETDEDYEAQREANKIISDYKYKLQKAEQEIASLQASLARSETQVIRYKSTAEAAEKAEAELKIERRKLQRENREATERLEELETSNNHLLKRLDKLKNAKSALLKDL